MFLIQNINMKGLKLIFLELFLIQLKWRKKRREPWLDIHVIEARIVLARWQISSNMKRMMQELELQYLSYN